MIGAAAAVLHGVRLRGFATTAEIAARADLDEVATTEELLDQQALGRVTWSEFAGAGGWSLTEAGRHENERLLGRELDAVPDGRARLARALEEFLPLNERLRQACTDWQLRPSATDHLAPNDHTDPQWDSQILSNLHLIASELASLEATLVTILPRFEGYHARFAAAHAKRRVDDRADSCHAIWFELHEDLLATLAIPRG